MLYIVRWVVSLWAERGELFVSLIGQDGEKGGICQMLLITISNEILQIDF